MSRRVWGFWEGEGETRRGREKGQRNGGSPMVRVSGRRHGEKMENHGQRKEKERKGRCGREDGGAARTRRTSSRTPFSRNASGGSISLSWRAPHELLLLAGFIVGIERFPPEINCFPG